MRESYGSQTSNSVVNIFAKFASKFKANFIFKMERTRNAMRIAFFQINGANLAVRFYMKKSKFQRIFMYKNSDCFQGIRDFKLIPFTNFAITTSLMKMRAKNKHLRTAKPSGLVRRRRYTGGTDKNYLANLNSGAKQRHFNAVRN